MPYKRMSQRLCTCGCGQTIREGSQFLRGHNARQQPRLPLIAREDGLCACGCGKKPKQEGSAFLQGHALGLKPEPLEHPCERCGKPTTNLMLCSVDCLARNPIERFWEKVNKFGPIKPFYADMGNCWTWTGSRDGVGGYGTFSYHGEARYGKAGPCRAHWFMLVVVLGIEIPEDEEILHLCDEPRCVRPEHLAVGPHQANMIDARTKGRMKKGWITPKGFGKGRKASEETKKKKAASAAVYWASEAAHERASEALRQRWKRQKQKEQEQKEF